jgi:UDP-N-acetylglucosamine diphosphorylase / glucose-1-phosphate thymidylyltransferase / UDP-N-acetylgalactosamine diphosphorylase / glucosamine-1-phosphate N-acetyltransferase / galactosamine-1-phosphate N-acetyltransferase
MINLNDFIERFPLSAEVINNLQPWEITGNLPAILRLVFPGLSNDYTIRDEVAVHRSSIIEIGVVIKSPAIIGANCIIGANVYLRNGVFLGDYVTIGPGCEIKSSIICSYTTIAHFNYIGNSMIGNRVNFEAGSVVANHYNERKNKRILVTINNISIDTGTEKFGSLTGDDVKIGANAVLSPGTVLKPGSVVQRLELIEQNAANKIGR